MGFAKIEIEGLCTKDAELKKSGSGNDWATCSIAVNGKEYNGEKHVDFFDIVAFGEQARLLAAYGKKGSPLRIHGKPTIDKWQAQDGSWRSKLKTIAFGISSPRDSQPQPQAINHNQTSSAQAVKAVTNDLDGFDDDIPF